MDDQVEKSQGGRPKKAAADRQSEVVSVRLTPAELAAVDAARPAGISRGEFLRAAGMGRELPRPVPAINDLAWRQLGKALGGVTTLLKFYALDMAGLETLRSLRMEIKLLRWRLRTGEDQR